MSLKSLHLLTGLAVTVVFLLTGQYLEHHQPKMNDLDNGTRMLFLSRHVYILLEGLVNLCLGMYFSYRSQPWRRVLQRAGSFLILAAPFVSIAAFFLEPTAPPPYNLTLIAMIAIYSGSLFHLVSYLWRRQKEVHASQG